MIEAQVVGERIAEFRKKLRLTQTALAEKLSVSPKTISKWEKGHGLPDVEILPDLADFFNTTIDYILLGRNKPIQKLNICTSYSEKEGQKHWIFPSIDDFPEEIRDGLLTHFLFEYAKRNSIDFTRFYEFVSGIRRPNTHEDAVQRIMDLEQVSIAKLQRSLCIGFSRGAQILDLMEEKNLIKRTDQKHLEWVNKDKDIITDIVNIAYSK